MKTLNHIILIMLVLMSSIHILNAQQGLNIRSGGQVTVNGNVNIIPVSFSIGESYGGGIIFYIDGTGQHGLISATTDQSTGAEWGCYGNTFGAIGTAIGTGQANTTAIVNGCSTTGIAARICNDLVLNGYNDWFLPSQNELNEMYIGNIITYNYNINYWSSSEYNANSAWLQVVLLYPPVPSHPPASKSNLYYVRAIRAF